MKIFFEDGDILVIEKPTGVPSENTRTGEPGIIELISVDRNDKNELYLIHRLDRNTGGVMVFAKNKKSAAKLSAQIQNGEFKKEYLCVTDGCPELSEGEYTDLLFKDSQKNRSYVVKRERKGVKKASLSYTVLDCTDSNALVNVLLHTGRTHQIRVQFSSRATPLTGDGKYGSRDNKCDTALWSHRIRFCHPSNKKQLEFCSLPDISVYPWNLFGCEKYE